MRSYNSRVFGCPEAKWRENRKRGSYAERLTHTLAIVYLTYTTQACAFLNAYNLAETKKCGLCPYLIHTIDQSHTLKVT